MVNQARALTLRLYSLVEELVCRVVCVLVWVLVRVPVPVAREVTVTVAVGVLGESVVVKVVWVQHLVDHLLLVPGLL